MIPSVFEIHALWNILFGGMITSSIKFSILKDFLLPVYPMEGANVYGTQKLWGFNIYRQFYV